MFKFEHEDGVAAVGEQQKWEGGEFGDEVWKKDEKKDFTIVSEDGNEIKVHKFVLEIRSDVFEAMFNSNMKESKENKVEITDFPFVVVEAAVKLIYNCNFSSTLSLDELVSLLQFFDKYQLPGPKAKVEPLLMEQIYQCLQSSTFFGTRSFRSSFGHHPSVRSVPNFCSIRSNPFRS